MQKSKAKKHKDLEQQYIDGEISEEEFESEMNELLNSGDEFLDVEEPSELAFRLKEIGQIVGALLLVGALFYVFLMTKGLILPVYVVGLFVGWLAYRKI